MASREHDAVLSPYLLDAEVSLSLSLDLMALLVQQHRHNTEEGEGGAAGLLGPGIGQGGDHVATRLRLPPGVNNRAASITNNVMVPA
jgi:hypothetical protein